MSLAVSFSQYVVQIITGLGEGAVLFLVASGLTLIFGALRVINFAHGSLFLLGAYITWSIADLWAFNNWNFWIIILLGGITLAAASVPLEVTFFRPIYGRTLLTQLLVTFAFVLVISGVVREVWGSQGQAIDPPPFLSGGVAVLDGQVRKVEFFFMGLAILVGILLWAVLYKTGLGRMIRAAVSDPQLLGLSGVNVKILFTGVFVLGVLFAGIAGGAVTLRGFIVPAQAIDAIIKAFVIVVIGGLGSLSGAFIAAMLVGVAGALGLFWVPQAAIAIVFAVLVAVLVIRPQGIMGTRGE
jgi:branched-subunit amino acid ABC-type transport system permease component